VDGSTFSSDPSELRRVFGGALPCPHSILRVRLKRDFNRTFLRHDMTWRANNKNETTHPCSAGTRPDRFQKRRALWAFLQTRTPPGPPHSASMPTPQQHKPQRSVTRAEGGRCTNHTHVFDNLAQFLGDDGRFGRGRRRNQKVEQRA
jgi:hypothetical protein